jgi:hypothetical protein
MRKHQYYGEFIKTECSTVSTKEELSSFIAERELSAFVEDCIFVRHDKSIGTGWKVTLFVGEKWSKQTDIGLSMALKEITGSKMIMIERNEPDLMAITEKNEPIYIQSALYSELK